MSESEKIDDRIMEMAEAGEDWEDIAEELGIDIEELFERYRELAYEHWDTGWEREAQRGYGRTTTGGIDLELTEANASIQIPEINESIPLNTVVSNEETKTVANADLSAETARELAAALNECADILEGEKQ